MNILLPANRISLLPELPYPAYKLVMWVCIKLPTTLLTHDTWIACPLPTRPVRGSQGYFIALVSETRIFLKQKPKNQTLPEQYGQGSIGISWFSACSLLAGTHLPNGWRGVGPDNSSNPAGQPDRSSEQTAAAGPLSYPPKEGKMGKTAVTWGLFRHKRLSVT